MPTSLSHRRAHPKSRSPAKLSTRVLSTLVRDLYCSTPRAQQARAVIRVRLSSGPNTFVSGWQIRASVFHAKSIIRSSGFSSEASVPNSTREPAWAWPLSPALCNAWADPVALIPSREKEADFGLSSQRREDAQLRAELSIG